MKRRFVCLLLTAALLTACQARPAAPSPTPAPSATPVPSATPAPAPTPAPVTAWADMEYEDFDADAFRQGLDRLTALAKGSDAQALCACYDELYAQFIRVYSMATMASVYNSLDTTDEVWAQRSVDSLAALAQASDALSNACLAAMQGPLAEALADHVGPKAAADLAGYEPMSERELALDVRRRSLATDYYARMAEQNELTVEYGGEEWTFDRLHGPDGDALRSSAYQAVRQALYQALADRVVPLYQELVRICDEEGRLRGYDGGAPFLYEKEYGRDYTPAEARALFAAVKAARRGSAYVPSQSPVLDRLDEVEPRYAAADEMLAAVHTLTGGLDPMFEEQWQYLVANGLYDFGSGPQRADTSATFELPAFNDGQFILICLDEDEDNLFTLVHEFGHFASLRETPCQNYLTAVCSADLAEVPSTALELLVLPGYDDVYDEGADIARFSRLADAWNVVVTQAMYAEFELDALEDPDLSAQKLGELYARLRKEYGLSDRGSPDYGWVNIPHLFFAPGYVVSYVAAGLASLQVWAAAEEDPDRGMEIYMDIVRAGCFDQNYTAVLEGAGLQSFAAPGTVTAVCGQTMEALQALEQKILSAEALAPAA